MTDKNLFSIEIHRHRQAKVNTYLTDKCIGFNYTTSVTPPHAQGSYSFSLRVGDADMVQPGDWLIHRDARGYAGFWGRVFSVSDGISVEGSQAVATTVTQVSVEGWTEVLQKALLFTPGGYIKESHGTLFSIQDWTVQIGKFLGTFSSDPLGKSLQALLQIVGRVRLPETLGGGWLGDEVKVVYDKVTAHLYAPELVDEMDALPSANMAPEHVSTQSVEANAYDVLRQLFVPEPALIEMFPYTSVRYEAQQSMSGISESTEVSDADTVSPGETTYPPWANPQAATTAKSFSILGNVLRGRPVLVYRIAPWRTRPLRESIFAQEEEPQKYLSAPEAMGGDKTASEPARRFPILDVMFTEATWTNGNLVHIPSEYVHSISRQRDDSLRLNCVWMAQGTGLGVEAIQQAGLPVMIRSEIEENGLRAKSPTWPFFIRRGDIMSSDEGSYLEYIRMLSAQVMQFHHRGHVMGQGQISMAYAPALVQNAYDRVSRQQDRAALTAGRAIVVDMPTGTPPYFAYADSVSHSVRVADAQAVEGTTTIQYSRGLYGWDEDALRDSPIPVPTMQPQPTTARAKVEQAARRNTAAETIAGEPDPEGPLTGKVAVAQLWSTFNWEAGIEGYLEKCADVVCVHLVNGNRPDPLSGFDRMKALSDRTGIELWGWGGHWCNTRNSAKEEARVAAEECLRTGVRNYLINAEYVWSGNPRNSEINFTITTDPEGHMLTFIYEFKSLVAGACKLSWNGLSTQEVTPRGSTDSVPAFSATVAQAIADGGGLYIPMCYFEAPIDGRSPRATFVSPSNGMHARLMKHDGIFDYDTRGAGVGTQRLDPKGFYAGDWYRDDGNGEAQVAAPLCKYIMPYYGAGMRGRFAGYTGAAPSLTTLLNQWKRTQR